MKPFKIILAASFLTSCNTSTDIKSIRNAVMKYASEREHFDGYMTRKFKHHISSDSTFYFLVSESGCPSCIENLIASYKKQRRAVFIMSPSAHSRYANDYRESENICIDSSGEINRLSYHQGNVGIIATSAGNIDTIISLEPSTLLAQVESINIH